MQAVNPYLKQYKKNQMETATPEQILILLYDGAIQYLNQAKIALDAQDNEQFQSNMLGCEKIIIEFMNTLKIEQGGKLAETLYRLYEYLNKTLVAAAVTREIEKIDEVLGHLMRLRETWQKAIEIANAEKDVELIDKHEEAEENNYAYDYEDDDDESEDGDAYESSEDEE